MLDKVSDLKARLFYFASVISVLGYITDAIFFESIHGIILLNCVLIFLIFITVIIYKVGKITSNFANSIIIYSSASNALIGLVISPDILTNPSGFFELASLFGILILYSGFSLRRIHLFVLATLYASMFFIFAFLLEIPSLRDNLPMILLLLVGYVFAVNAIINIINNYQKEQDQLIQNLQEANLMLKEKGEELNNMLATKDKLFSIIGHDLKTPSNTIMGFSELISKITEKSDDAKLSVYSKMIYQSANRLNGLLNQLLDWARIQIGHSKPNFTLINPSKLVKEAVDLMRGTIYLKKINVIYPKIDDNQINADRQMLFTVIRNLLTNALKFTDQQGQIEIKTKLENNLYSYSITDTGVGMSSEILSQLFKLAALNSTHGTQDETGTGIGLMICKGYITAHQGRIWAESKPGEGSTFYFEIPC